MSDTENRAAYITGLRELASMLETHSELPLPSDNFIRYCWSDEEFTPAVKALGSCNKEYSEYYATVSRMFGPIKYGVQISREKVCTRRVVGTKKEPERYIPGYTVPEREVEIVEWDCHPLLAEPPETEKQTETPEY